MEKNLVLNQGNFKKYYKLIKASLGNTVQKFNGIW
jgi:hypothetical protein